MIARSVRGLYSVGGARSAIASRRLTSIKNHRTIFSESKKAEELATSSLPVKAVNDPPAASTATSTAVESTTETPAHLQNIVESTTEPLKYGDLAELGLCNKWYGFVQQALEAVHVSTGLPWWATIAVTTVSLRLALFPLLRNSLIHTSRMAVHQPEMQAKINAMTAAKKQGKDQEAAVLGQEMRMFMKEKNLKPLRGLVLPLIQMPLFIAFYFGLDDMARLPLKQMAEGGFGWVQNLTVPDYTCILPIISSSLMFKSISMGPDGSGSVQSPQAQKMKPFFQIGSFIIVPMAWWLQMPSAVFIYWCTTNAFSLAQSYLLSSTAVRKSMGLPSLDTIAENNKKNFPQQYASENQKQPGFMESVKSSYNTFREEFEEKKKPMLEEARQREKANREKLIRQSYESERSDKGLYESAEAAESKGKDDEVSHKNPTLLAMDDEKRARALKNEQQRLARFQRNSKRQSRY
ncbi:hypothetical protein WALSEDRAFT_59611 [Wallemia mellicola CBS 633.66]|uniref:Membrane insertase YidC/Oxa/ALB C-terminal domain-containing protein n=1 Tax=Wallemia mellicola (strain ATCC MYA-4683 / CBS 633.66) TaxID=671144 RepID=I4YHJ9_WALMC|nr:hypothetical protein WALSEDRAFT_59611 [Wallemia mellicola CBS 633.66]TIB78452.1 hypothetical protein E3Q23_00790 [Wallemia mellicola]EIM23441.1 hypothetical protein WALSEDRAFT_59611 [Wallemia mellicola CBS 633.66]TIC16323.1 hypothetical protein E3Q15_01235 [Wallemia mellicola]TIC33233.1 hypothetical protein E3Q11_00270 [Wallemia mellicola]TIC75898.1 hypothetical protein E3Q00_00283 [Wallemia mellicola]|eukprot:XP_006956815.1 hypothetical protein WALSEDRAFT_59611 [Wallemia mellicola CBS 633.66]